MNFSGLDPMDLMDLLGLETMSGEAVGRLVLNCCVVLANFYCKIPQTERMVATQSTLSVSLLGLCLETLGLADLNDETHLHGDV